MDKIQVSICSNPTCYIQGARLFKALGTVLSQNLKDQIKLTGSACNGVCAAAGGPLAPCARVNGRLIASATPGDVVQAVRRELRPARLVA